LELNGVLELGSLLLVFKLSPHHQLVRAVGVLQHPPTWQSIFRVSSTSDQNSKTLLTVQDNVNIMKYI
jgi:hypothetical protein